MCFRLNKVYDISGNFGFDEYGVKVMLIEFLRMASHIHSSIIGTKIRKNLQSTDPKVVKKAKKDFNGIVIFCICMMGLALCLALWPLFLVALPLVFLVVVLKK